MKLSFKFLDDWANPWRMYLAEFIGTFVFVFVVMCIPVIDSLYGGFGRVGLAVIVGLIYTSLTYATVNISGGFLNPSITLSLWLCQKISGPKTFFYILAQLVASFCASALVFLIFGKYAIQILPGAVKLGIGVSTESAIAIEAIITAILVFVVFATVVDSRKHDGFGPLAVGFSVGALTLVFAPVTGAVLNISRIFGLAIITKSYYLLFVYIVGGLVGSLFGLVYDVVFLKKEKKK